MNIIFRADDLGMSEAVNYGILKSVAEGPINNVGLMPNMSTAVHGYDLIKEYGVCLGQHTNICLGRPVSDPESIPSLVGDDGLFCTSREIRSRTADTIVLEEAEIEVQAQLDRFREITGKNPAYFEGHAVMSNAFFTALKNVAARNGLFYVNPMEPDWSERYHVQCAAFYHLDEHGLYDIDRYIFGDEGGLAQRSCAMLVFHPGYIDQFLLDHSSYTVIRPMETAFLTSERLRQWIQNKHVKCITFDDVQAGQL